MCQRGRIHKGRKKNDKGRKFMGVKDERGKGRRLGKKEGPCLSKVTSRMPKRVILVVECVVGGGEATTRRVGKPA